MTTYFTELTDGGKKSSFDTMDEALGYIANNFQTNTDDLGIWSNDDIKTMIWMTQEDADAAEDNTDVIATITEVA